MMRRTPVLPADLRALVERASARQMTVRDRERQIVSLAYGNARLEDDRVTRVLVEQAVAKLRRQPPWWLGR